MSNDQGLLDHRLPTYLTQFIGREREITFLRQLRDHVLAAVDGWRLGCDQWTGGAWRTEGPTDHTLRRRWLRQDAISA